jgi:hypothetical protein
MALFGIGNLLLKYKRADLKRPHKTLCVLGWGGEEERRGEERRLEERRGEERRGEERRGEERRGEFVGKVARVEVVGGRREKRIPAVPLSHPFPSWGFAVVAILGVSSALVGNIMIDVRVLGYFSIYFFTTLVVVGVMMFRTRLLRIVYQAASRIPGFEQCMGDSLKDEIKKLQVWIRSRIFSNFWFSVVNFSNFLFLDASFCSAIFLSFDGEP